MSSGMKFFYALLLAVLVWLVVRLIRKAAAFVRWHRDKRPGFRFYRSALILPLVIWALPLLYFSLQWEFIPEVPADDLITIQGTISDYRTDTERVGRYSHRTYVDGFYLDGGSAYYDMPWDNYDPEEFEEQIGMAPVTVEYGINEAGSRQVYGLTTGDGTQVLAYGSAANYFLQTILLYPAILVGLLLWGVGWILSLPARLYLDGSDEEAAKAVVLWKKVRFSLVGYIAIFVILLIGPWFPDSDRNLHTISTPVDLDGVVQVNLLGEWTEDEGWYYNQQDVSIRMYLYDLGTPQEAGLTQEGWYEDYFTSIRAFTLETFLKPGSWTLFESWEQVQLPDGQGGRMAQGYGEADNGLRNQLITAAFPAEGAAVMFQVSAWDLEPEELEEYAQENVLPVIPYLEFAA